MKLGSFILCALPFLYGCSQSVPVRCLAEGKGNIFLSGGALAIEEDGPEGQFYPIISAGYYYGVSNDVTLGGEIFPLFIFAELVGASFGIVGRISAENGIFPEVTGSGHVYTLMSFERELEISAFPAARMNLSWSNSHGTMFFVGSEATLLPEEDVYLSPFIGVGHRTVSGRGAQFELKLTSMRLSPEYDFFESVDEARLGIYGTIFF
jgi:hypothetical protein